MDESTQSAQLLLNSLNAHLQTAAGDSSRAATYDMDDTADDAVLKVFPRTQEAIRWLNEHLCPQWRKVDETALQQQRVHRALSRIAISTGTAAIIMAVLQLTFQQIWPLGKSVATVLEALAVFVGGIAVIVGLIAKYMRGWIENRHLAERIRMLKFRAIGSADLWNGNVSAWKQWVTDELALLQRDHDWKHVEEWAEMDTVEQAPPSALSATIGPDFSLPMTAYYRWKRINFQSRYFERRASAFHRQVKPWMSLSVPIFFASVICVLLHFSAELIAHRIADGEAHAARTESPLAHAGTSETAAPSQAFHAGTENGGRVLFETLGSVFLAAAAIFPVLGFGIRSWFSAMEMPRSASLFGAKHRALERAEQDLIKSSGQPALTLQHIARDEHFLEHEHREWLRLMMETEWFL
jgi:hypothetical protein